MNWTGGRLSRHSRNPNNSLTQRQKQHFARVRSNLVRAIQKKSPIKWSMFDKAGEVPRQDGPELPATPHLVRSRQLELDLNVRRSPSRRYDSEINLKPELAQATFQGDEKRRLEWKPCERPPINGGSDQGHIHGTSRAIDAAENISADYEADSLAERRRRILSRFDWVGANIQHPLKLRFTIAGDDERLAKRRRIATQHRAQFGAAAQPMITLPFAKPKLKQKLHSSFSTQSANGNSTRTFPKTHVRISIGGKDVAAGVGSSTSYCKTVGGRFATPHASISDEMLLDGDDMSRQRRYLSHERRDCLSFPASPLLVPLTVNGTGSALSACPKSVPVRTPHRKKILSSSDRSNDAFERPASDTLFDSEGRIPVSLTGLSPNVAQHFDKRFDNFEDLSDQQNAPATKSHSNMATLRKHGVRILPSTTSHKFTDVTQVLDERTNPESLYSNARYITDVSRQLSESARKLQSVARDKSRRNAQFHYQPELLHPKPLTSRMSRVLCNTSSETGSNVAQISLEPMVTRSHVLDEEIWKTWVLSSQDDLPSGSRNENYDNVSISPGISNFGRRCVPNDSDSAIERTKDIMTQVVSDYNYGSDQEIEQSRLVSATDPGKQSDHREVRQNSEENIHHEDLLSKNAAVDYKSLFISRPIKVTSSLKPKPVQVKNPDEAWMRFILSDSENDHEDDSLQPHVLQRVLPPSPIQHTPASSKIVHLSDKTTSSFQPELTIFSASNPNTTSNDAKYSTTVSSIDEPHTSNHTTRGSNTSISSDELSHAPSSVDLIRTHPSSSSSTPSQPIRKLTFTKPPRFRGLGPGSSPKTTAATAGSPVHIGKGFSPARLRNRSVEKNRDVGRAVARRKGYRERDIYSLESGEDVESIEDD